MDRGGGRQAACAQLLQQAGWSGATAGFLAGDASNRSYLRLTRGDNTAVLMDAPPDQGEGTQDFIRVALFLQSLGLSAPKILAADTEHGFLLLEDLGDAVYSRVLANQPDLELPLYRAALDAVVRIQANAPLPGIPALSEADWAASVGAVLPHYLGSEPAARASLADVVDCLAEIIAPDLRKDPVVILRDFHADNLIWLPDRHGAAKAGLLDFQLAQLGHPVYDVVSLLQDARRDVDAQTHLQIGRAFCDAKGISESEYQRASAVWGAQRALRILGIFARLALMSGKRAYLPLMPRVWGHLQSNLRHPALARLQALCEATIPAPQPAYLQRFAAHADK